MGWIERTESSAIGRIRCILSPLPPCVHRHERSRLWRGGLTEPPRRGAPVKELCRKLGISDQTFYVWKKKYAGMGVLELKRVKQLEDENRRLKQVVADLTLDKAMLQDLLSRTF